MDTSAAPIEHEARDGDVVQSPTPPDVNLISADPSSTAPTGEMMSQAPKTTMEDFASGPTEADSVPLVGVPQHDDEGTVRLHGSNKGVDDDPEMESRSNSSDPGEDERSGTADYLSQFSTRDLYDAYTMRLGKNDTVGGKTKKHKAPRMVRGVIDYVRTLEDRLRRLEEAQTNRAETEEEVESEQGEVGSQESDERESCIGEETGGAEPKEEEDKQQESDESKGFIEGVKFFHSAGEFDNNGWKDNSKATGSYQCNTDPLHRMRVLYDWIPGSRPSMEMESPEPDAIDILALGIVSAPITTFFRSLLEVNTGSTKSVQFEKPFRPLIHNVQVLRDQLAKLEERYRHPEQGQSTLATKLAEDPILFKTDVTAEGDAATHDTLPFPAIRPSEDEESSPFETKEALDHFRILLDFIDKYFAKQLKLIKRLKEGREDKIAFENLWMLFNTGDDIYCPSLPLGSGVSIKNDDGGTTHASKPRYTPQVFRILGASSGLPLLKIFAPDQKIEEAVNNPQLPEVMGELGHGGMPSDSDQPSNSSPQRNRNRFMSLNVVCFNIDFDGFEYGTVKEGFIFKPFDGLVDVRSLQAYPVQYLKTHLTLPLPGSDIPEPDHLLERGKKFIKYTAVSHLSYEGMTVGKSREEIHSAVMVDFKLAVQEYQRAFPEDDNPVPKFMPLAGFWIRARARNMNSRGMAVELYWHSKNDCDGLWCHRLDCIIDAYDFALSLEPGRVESKIKEVLELYEGGKPRQHESFQLFKKHMEETKLTRLLPGVVPGFVLRNRKWVQLNLDRLKEFEPGDEWGNLVLTRGHKKMVRAMVETHTVGSQDSKSSTNDPRIDLQMDLVQGKGRGCIILLHGVPGVGKTSTAECVAAYTNRPLYPITCGDIGYTPEQVEKNMEQHFMLAHRWGCVLLLDEADVFLAKRDKTDVKRNGLVSVFLRILEYYSGILFLTTNRVGAIDDAFRSRLHLTLFYPKLAKAQTRKIWENNLERMKSINKEREQRNLEPIQFDKDKIMKWVDRRWRTLQWNGRQIRNAFQTSVALAQFEYKVAVEEKGKAPKCPKLKVRHFQQIAEAAMEFSEYLHQTFGRDEDTMAARDQLRPLSFDRKGKSGDFSESSSSSSSSSEGEGEESDESGDGSSGESSSEDEEEKKPKRGQSSRKKKEEEDSEEQDEERKSKKKGKSARKKKEAEEAEEAERRRKKQKKDKRNRYD